MTAFYPTSTRSATGPRTDTPFLEFDVDLAVRRAIEIARAFPATAVHYAVKANPHPVLLARLVEAEIRFDVASPAEMDDCLRAGAAAADLIYTNPVKRAVDIAYAWHAGVGTLVVDSHGEMEKVAANAPGAKLLCRLATSGAGADWTLSRKFGTGAADCIEILDAAAGLGLVPAGVAFHVGSQQRDPHRWGPPIAAAAGIFAELRRRGHRPSVLDLGGGFPADHVGDHPDLSRYGAVIDGFIETHFPERPETIVEPGRGIAGDAGTLVASVTGVCRRGDVRWVYLDAGVFTGLVETIDEAIRYRLDFGRPSAELGPAVLAGPTCDSLDVLYERTPVMLPLDLAEGDVIRFLSAGAYTSSYSTVGFNGFAPLPTRLVPGLRVVPGGVPAAR